MAIYRKSKFEINLMKQAGNIVALVHAAMKDAIKEGVTTKELDELAQCQEAPLPYSTCIRQRQLP